MFHGEIVDINDVITFQGTTPDTIKQAFRDSIDDYLDFCAVRNEAPEKPFSGKLMLRMTSDLHHSIFVQAKQAKKSINAYITDILLGAVCYS